MATKHEAAVAPAAPAHPMIAHRRLRELLAEVCSDGDEPLNEALCKTTQWEPLFRGKDELIKALANVREDTMVPLATAFGLCGFTPQQMRDFSGGRGLDECLHTLECLKDYRERVEELQHAIGCAFARLFAATHEIHGIGSRPALALVEA